MSTQKQLIEQISAELAEIKSKLPNGELKVIEKCLKDLEVGQADLKDDIRIIQKRLFNPDSGLIVETNKNTEFRTHCDDNMPSHNSNMEEVRALLAWKDNVSKALWVIFTTMAGVIAKLIFWS